MVEKSKEPVVIKGDEHEIKDDAFTVQVTVNDEYYVTEGNAEKVDEKDCRGYLLYTSLPNGESCMNGQGEISFLRLMRHLIALKDPKELMELIKKAATIKALEM